MSGALYREFEPCEALRPFVRAIFTFSAPRSDGDTIRPGDRIIREIVTRAGEPCWSALFADSDVSVVFCSERGYRIAGLWNSSQPHVIGPMPNYFDTAPEDQLIQTGAWIAAGHASRFLSVPAMELTGRVLGLDHFWGNDAARTQAQLQEATTDSGRAAILENALVSHLRQLHAAGSLLDVPRLAGLARLERGRVSVESMACLGGVSRQYLTRVFRQHTGISPKLFLRLCRFRSALQFAGSARHVRWPDFALDCGYADQAHMIAEFREFSGMTPGVMVKQRPFHPFTGY